MSHDFRVGTIVPGYCRGMFDLSTMGHDLRVEALGADWLVLRDETTHEPMFCDRPEDLAHYADDEWRQRERELF